MKQKAHKADFTATLVVLMVVFVSAIFFADANLSFAASDTKKSPAVDKTPASDHAEARIKELQSALKITKAQEELWNKLTQVMRENAKEMDALTKDRAEKTKSMNAVEHMKFYSQISETRLAQMKKFIPHFEEFYASLSDEQKKATDTIFNTGRHGKHKRK